MDEVKLKKRTVEEVVEQMIMDVSLLKVQMERMERHVHQGAFLNTSKPVVLEKE